MYVDYRTVFSPITPGRSEKRISSNDTNKKPKEETMTNEELYQLMKDGFDQVKADFAEINQRFSEINQRLDGMDGRLRDVENGISELKVSKVLLRECAAG